MISTARKRFVFIPSVSGILLALLLLQTACNTPLHPGAISAFDSSAYDTFLVSNGALTAIRAQVATAHPEYKEQFNAAAAAYATAYTAYVSFRQAPNDPTSVQLAIANLTVSIVALESSFQQAMHASPAEIASARAKAAKIRSHALKNNAAAAVTLADILTELEIASAVAEAIPPAAPYAAIAQLVIQATSQALAAHSAQAGQPINLSLIAPVPVIG